MEKAEAERMEGDYNRAYAEFSVKHAQNAPMVEALKKVPTSSLFLGCTPPPLLTHTLRTPGA